VCACARVSERERVASIGEKAIKVHICGWVSGVSAKCVCVCVCVGERERVCACA